jgi:hypothetical protein
MENSSQLLCTCFTPALHLLCTCFTPALHLLYTCFTPCTSGSLLRYLGVYTCFAPIQHLLYTCALHLVTIPPLHHLCWRYPLYTTCAGDAPVLYTRDNPVLYTVISVLCLCDFQHMYFTPAINTHAIHPCFAPPLRTSASLEECRRAFGERERELSRRLRAAFAPPLRRLATNHTSEPCQAQEAAVRGRPTGEPCPIRVHPSPSESIRVHPSPSESFASRIQLRAPPFRASRFTPCLYTEALHHVFTPRLYTMSLH